MSAPVLMPVSLATGVEIIAVNEILTPNRDEDRK